MSSSTSRKHFGGGKASLSTSAGKKTPKSSPSSGGKFTDRLKGPFKSKDNTRKPLKTLEQEFYCGMLDCRGMPDTEDPPSADHPNKANRMVAYDPTDFRPVPNERWCYMYSFNQCGGCAGNNVDKRGPRPTASQIVDTNLAYGNPEARRVIDLAEFDNFVNTTQNDIIIRFDNFLAQFDNDTLDKADYTWDNKETRTRARIALKIMAIRKAKAGMASDAAAYEFERKRREDIKARWRQLEPWFIGP